MPFKSQAQARAAFAGALGPKMKALAPEFAAKTPSLKALPARVPGSGSTRHHLSITRRATMPKGKR